MEPLMKVHFKGHPNVLATNRMTLEVTKEDFLTLRGDCIVGILADAACADLDPAVKAAFQAEGSKIRFLIEVEGAEYEFEARGCASLPLSHPMSIVIRKSSYVSDRTLAVRATAAACDLPRRMVERLAHGAHGELSAFSL